MFAIQASGTSRPARSSARVVSSAPAARRGRCGSPRIACWRSWWRRSSRSSRRSTPRSPSHAARSSRARAKSTRAESRRHSKSGSAVGRRRGDGFRPGASEKASSSTRRSRARLARTAARRPRVSRRASPRSGRGLATSRATSASSRASRLGQAIAPRPDAFAPETSTSTSARRGGGVHLDTASRARTSCVASTNRRVVPARSGCAAPSASPSASRCWRRARRSASAEPGGGRQSRPGAAGVEKRGAGDPDARCAGRRKSLGEAQVFGDRLEGLEVEVSSDRLVAKRRDEARPRCAGKREAKRADPPVASPAIGALEGASVIASRLDEPIGAVLEVVHRLADANRAVTAGGETLVRLDRPELDRPGAGERGRVARGAGRGRGRRWAGGRGVDRARRGRGAGGA